MDVLLGLRPFRVVRGCTVCRRLCHADARAVQPFVYASAVDKALLGSYALEVAKLAALEPHEEPLLK